MCSTYPPPIPRKKNWEEGDYNWKEKEGKLKGPFWSVMDGGGVGLWTLSLFLEGGRGGGGGGGYIGWKCVKKGERFFPFLHIREAKGGKGKGGCGEERGRRGSICHIWAGLDGGRKERGKGGNFVNLFLSSSSFVIALCRTVEPKGEKWRGMKQ